jgi:hypothetical protein
MNKPIICASRIRTQFVAPPEVAVPLSPAVVTRAMAPNGGLALDPSQRSAIIAQAAYFRAQKRGFDPAHEVEDWLAAEQELEGLLA